MNDGKTLERQSILERRRLTEVKVVIPAIGSRLSSTTTSSTSSMPHPLM